MELEFDALRPLLERFNGMGIGPTARRDREAPAPGGATPPAAAHEIACAPEVCAT